MYAQLLQHFQADPFQTLHTLLGWSEDMHIVFFRILKLFCITFYCIFNLDFLVFFFFFFFFFFWNEITVYCFSSCLTYCIRPNYCTVRLGFSKLQGTLEYGRLFSALILQKCIGNMSLCGRAWYMACSFIIVCI